MNLNKLFSLILAITPYIYMNACRTLSPEIDSKTKEISIQMLEGSNKQDICKDIHATSKEPSNEYKNAITQQAVFSLLSSIESMANTLDANTNINRFIPESCKNSANPHILVGLKEFNSKSNDSNVHQVLPIIYDLTKKIPCVENLTGSLKKSIYEYGLKKATSRLQSLCSDTNSTIDTYIESPLAFLSLAHNNNFSHFTPEYCASVKKKNCSNDINRKLSAELDQNILNLLIKEPTCKNSTWSIDNTLTDSAIASAMSCLDYESSLWAVHEHDFIATTNDIPTTDDNAATALNIVGKPSKVIVDMIIRATEKEERLVSDVAESITRKTFDSSQLPPSNLTTRAETKVKGKIYKAPISKDEPAFKRKNYKDSTHPSNVARRAGEPHKKYVERLKTVLADLDGGKAVLDEIEARKETYDSIVEKKFIKADPKKFTATKLKREGTQSMTDDEFAKLKVKFDAYNKSMRGMVKFFSDSKLLYQYALEIELKIQIEILTSRKSVSDALETVYSRIEKKGGFGKVIDLEARSYTSEEWWEMLRKGKPFHDVTFTTTGRYGHGVNTHRLQFILLIQDMESRPNVYFDKGKAYQHTIAELFKFMGNEGLRGRLVFAESPSFQSLFNSFDSFAKNGTCPEFMRELYTHGIGSAETLP
ncbi:MAG: hypothetical protein R3B45_12985 [Bdellovibrionota bacterium]